MIGLANDIIRYKRLPTLYSNALLRRHRNASVRLDHASMSLSLDEPLFLEQLCRVDSCQTEYSIQGSVNSYTDIQAMNSLSRSVRQWERLYGD